MNVHNEEEEDAGPSVDSSDPKERIAARRIRIERRNETAKRKVIGEEAILKKPVDFDKNACKSKKQIKDSCQRLLKLKSDGSELVSNVQVAADARENVRRMEEEEARRNRFEKLEAESKAAIEKFDEVCMKHIIDIWSLYPPFKLKHFVQPAPEVSTTQITKKWSLALSHEIPQDLFVMLTEQKNACDMMIDEKNKLINDFQQELKCLDDHYVKDLKKQAEDVNLMLDRMEEQIKNLTKAYCEELLQIEKAFVSERSEMIDNNRKKWQALMQQRRDKEVEFLESRRKRVEDYEKQLDMLRVHDAEEYNMVKIKLETDVQILEQQLQQMKATYQLNQEKLEYNFQVLKKRDEENTITKSQQKRKITRLQDSLNNLKSKLTKQEKSYREDNQSLTDDYERITEQYRELQKKFRHFQTTDSKMFIDMWSMNENQAKELIKNLLEEDQIIHQHQLGLCWIKPQLDFLDSNGPLMVVRTNDESKLSAAQVAQKVLTTDISNDYQTQQSVAGKTDLSPSATKAVLELLSDETGFLVETKLKKLLAPLDKDEQSLMRLDAIFSALGVDNEDDVYKLARYFLATAETQTAGLQQDACELAEMSESEDKAKEGSSFEPCSSAKDLPKLIHPNEVIKKLRTFVEENRHFVKDSRKVGFQKVHCSGTRDSSLDAKYWQNMSSVIDYSKEHVWDALLDGFDKYLSVLTERAALVQETDALEQQNSELRMLLHQYINSKVNQELEVPPTRLLKFDVTKNV